MALQRRAAAPPPPPPPVVAEGPNFGDLTFYGGGGFVIPEGNYVAVDHQVAMWAPPERNGKRTEPKLYVLIKFQDRNNPGAEYLEQPYSMGQKAHLSWAPNPSTGKGLVAIAGGLGTAPPTSTNWGMYLASLYQSGLEPGVFTNDLSVLDGIWVDIKHELESDDRKNFGSAAKTGETADQQQQHQTPRKIAVVFNIPDEGKPWEGGGGELSADAPAPAKPAAAPKPAVKPAAAAKPAVAPKTAAAPVTQVAVTEVAGDDDGELKAVLVSAFGTILSDAPPSYLKLKLRTGSFKILDEQYGADVAKKSCELYFANEASLNSVLAEVNYISKGNEVVLAG